MKRISLMLSAIALAMGMLGAQPTKEVQSQSTYEFTDDLGRTVTLPSKLERVVASGPLTEYMLTPIAVEKMVGRAVTWSKAAESFLSPQYLEKPIVGQLYGGKGSLNPETILSLDAQVVIDIGEQKANMKEDLDKLEAQLGIPFIHLDTDFTSMAETYARLGEMFGQEQKASQIASFITRVTKRNEKLTQKGKIPAIYVQGSKGINVTAKGSYQGGVLDSVIDNLAVVENPTSKGTGNQVDMEQIMKWNPPYILFAGDAREVYEKAEADPLWSQIDAVKNHKMLLVPNLPMNWLVAPPSINRIAGIIWIDKVAYGGDFDLEEELREYFKLFFAKDVTKEQLESFLGK